MSLQLSSWYSVGGAMVIRFGGDEYVSPEPIAIAGIPSGAKSFPWPYLPESCQQKTIFMRDLRDPRLSVVTPIPVLVDFSDGQVTACSYDVEQFGVGEDEFSALDDLRATIIELYFTLKAERKLGPLPQRQLDYLVKTLREA